MYICDNGHSKVVHENPYYCPLCHLMVHNIMVHDFTESKGQKLVDELVEYQKNQNTKGKTKC